mmetsp:Transcript_141387/g.439420  ORF Transcript_141387/g.439420 Transcript_141387/m.439420 type:complete len:126 (-) Transcript_141387:377-754(-)
MEVLCLLVIELVVKKTLSLILLLNGKPAITLFGGFTLLFINPSGKFFSGGTQAYAGLPGRKLYFGTFGGWSALGGGVFSGTGLTMCGLFLRALLLLSYALGVAKHLSLIVLLFGVVKESLSEFAL